MTDRELQVVVTTTESAGAKGFFDGPGEASLSVLSGSKLAAAFKDFSQSISDILTQIEASSNTLVLEKVEFSAELTAKGEFRLIAAAGVETKGAVKLTFSRK